jgi:hypothetical protein
MKPKPGPKVVQIRVEGIALLELLKQQCMDDWRRKEAAD